MKLLLSDGTAVAVSSYEKTNTTVNGNTVDAISVTVEKTTLEKVKTLFSDSENLAVLHIYSDENILTDTFSGYQIRKSIALGETDTSFVVVLAKSSEVNEQITTLTNEVSLLKTAIDELNSKNNSVDSTITELTQSISDNKKTLTELSNKITEAVDSINKVTESDSDQKDTINNLDIDFTKIKKSFEEITATVQSISQTCNSLTESVNATNLSTTEALTVVDKARQEMVTRSDSIDQLLSLVNEVKDLATTNDEKVISYGSTAEVLTENVNSAKLAVENFEANLTKTNKNVTDLSSTVSNNTSSISSLSDDMKSVSANVVELDEKNTSTNESVAALTTRVANIEPVTDYTKLSLDDAKKFRIAESKTVLADFLENHPVTSSCHGGTAAAYSITSEKQSFLQAMITITMLAQQSGVEYQPSWNAVGEACTYDWTLEELQQLAIEIEATVRPLVSHQQSLEKEILAVKNMNALKAVNISYDDIKANEIVKNETTAE